MVLTIRYFINHKIKAKCSRLQLKNFFASNEDTSSKFPMIYIHLSYLETMYTQYSIFLKWNIFKFTLQLFIILQVKMCFFILFFSKKSQYNHFPAAAFLFQSSNITLLLLYAKLTTVKIVIGNFVSELHPLRKLKKTREN